MDGMVRPSNDGVHLETPQAQTATTCCPSASLRTSRSKRVAMSCLSGGCSADLSTSVVVARTVICDTYNSAIGCMHS